MAQGEDADAADLGDHNRCDCRPRRVLGRARAHVLHPAVAFGVDGAAHAGDGGSEGRIRLYGELHPRDLLPLDAEELAEHPRPLDDLDRRCVGCGNATTGLVKYVYRLHAGLAERLPCPLAVAHRAFLSRVSLSRTGRQVLTVRLCEPALCLFSPSF